MRYGEAFSVNHLMAEQHNIEIKRARPPAFGFAYAALLQKAPPGEVVNICSGRVYSLRDVLVMMAEIAGYPIEARVNPAFVRASEVKTLSGNPARLRALIGDDWHSPPLQDTLRWMLQG